MTISKTAIDFPSENRINNNKEWYKAHKSVYRNEVVAPLAFLVENLSGVMFDIDPLLICSPKIGGSISRVRRDTRFSLDKTLYRDTAWICFSRRKEIYEGPPAFFFEFSPRGWDYGCGWYKADSESLNYMRDCILENNTLYTNAKRAYDSQNTFLLEGNKYKRSHFPAETEEKRDWLDRTGMSFVRYEKDNTILFSDKLSDILKRDFLLLKDEYLFMISAYAEAHSPR